MNRSEVIALMAAILYAASPANAGITLSEMIQAAEGALHEAETREARRQEKHS